MHTRSLLFLALLCPPIAGWAGDANSPDVGGSVLQMLFGFALILGLLFATLWLLKKLSVPRGAGGGLVRVVSAAAVGPRERVVVVDVADRRLVLGVAPGRVSLLNDQPQPPEDQATGAGSAVAAPSPDFADWLKRTLSRRNER